VTISEVSPNIREKSCQKSVAISVTLRSTLPGFCQIYVTIPICRATGGGAAPPAVAALHWREQPAMPVGCGTGHFTRWFAKQGLHITGLDASPAMLEQARLRNGTNYLLGDALALPFENRRFDLVALITTLEFVTDPVQALREALRVARQGLLLGMLNRHSLLRRQRPGGIVAQAHRFSVTTLTRCVRQAAGTRSVIITWRTTIFPGRFPSGATWLPWGEYVGMSVELEPMERSTS
jgi:SAM-dependent methyltransferase